VAMGKDDGRDIFGLITNFLDIGDDLLGISRGSRIYHRQVLIVDYHVDVAMSHIAVGLIYVVDATDDFQTSNSLQ
jgi:hypothetical protein